MGTVNGPVSSVVGNVVLWNDTTGTTVSDSGKTLSLQGLSNVTYQTGGAPSNMIIGQQVTLASGATNNTFIGELAGATAASSTSGTSYNTAVGYEAMSNLTSAASNTALGAGCLLSVTDGAANTAVGRSALAAVTSGDENTAVGNNALGATTLGSNNVAVGYLSLANAVVAIGNVAIGANTGTSLTSSSGNILIGNGTDVPAASTSHFLNIGDLIFATGMTGSLQSPAGSIGIGTPAPVNSLSVSPLQYSSGTASQSGTTVTGVGTTWTPDMVGAQFNFPNYPGSPGTITAFNSATSLTVSSVQTVAAQAYTINYTGLQVTSAGNVGIGNSSPSAMLDIGYSGSTLGTVRMEGSTSGYVQLQPAAAAGSWTMTLPSSSGTSGQVLQTDGTGVTSWVTERTLLTAATNYYVATTGSDSNPGTSGSPWLTIQHAINYIQQKIDLGGQTVTINVANGTYTGGITVSAPFTGSGTVQVTGNITTPSNCIISTTGAHCISVTGGAQLSVAGFKTQTSASPYCHIVVIGPASAVYVNGNWNFGGGVSNTTYSHMYAQLGGMINVSANYTISYGAVNHWYAIYNGLIIANSLTLTLSGTPAFTFFANGLGSATLGIVGNTYSGSATGTRYTVGYNAFINSGGTTLPGSIAGSTAAGGQYA